MNFYHQQVPPEMFEDDDADAASRSPPKLAGFVGMSGWLPFAGAIAETLPPSNVDDEDDIFGHGGEDEDGADAAPAYSLAFNLTRDIASPEPISLPADKLPLFITRQYFWAMGQRTRRHRCV
jgi:hypothetical protein